MITESEMYWITRLDNFAVALMVIMGVCAFVTIVLTMGGCVLRDNYEGSPAVKEGKRLHKIAFRLGIAVLVLVIGASFLPSTREYAAIKIIPMVANSEAVQRDVPELYKLAVDWAKGQMAPKKAKE